MPAKFSKKIITLVIRLNIAFAVVVFVMVWFDKEVPPELILAWYGFTGAEILALAGIKVREIMNENKE